MIKVACIMCDRPLIRKGAIFLTSPRRVVAAATKKSDLVEKMHICVGCEKDVLNFIERREEET